MQYRRVVRKGLQRVNDGGERVIADVDEVDRVLGDVAIIGQNHRDRLAHITHLVLCDRPAFDGQLDPDHQRRCDACIILARQDGVNACQPARGIGRYVGDPGMGVGAAQDGGMQRSLRRRQVIKELAAPGQKRGVFHPQHRMMQPVLWHASSPPKPSSGVAGH